MAKSSTSNNVVLVMILIGGIIAMKIDTTLGQKSPPPPPPPPKENNTSCVNLDTANFIVYCSSAMNAFLKRFRMPSKKCCTYAQKANIPLFCKRFVNEAERVYNGTKVAEVARYCRHPLPKGTKCGSKSLASLILCLSFILRLNI